MIADINKAEIIDKYKNHNKDTGSASVQIALLSSRISYLTEHLKIHRKDVHSRRGLIAMTTRRRKLLDYVKKHNLDQYNELLKSLKLRR